MANSATQDNFFVFNCSSMGLLVYICAQCPRVCASYVRCHIHLAVCAGKSTLADQLLLKTETVAARDMMVSSAFEYTCNCQQLQMEETAVSTTNRH